MSKKRNSLTCHLCNFAKPNMAQCSIARCSLSYCIDCIKSLMDKNFQKQKYVRACWVCYSCGKTCKCDICLGNLPTRKKVVPPRQKPVSNMNNLIDKGFSKFQKLRQSKKQDEKINMKSTVKSDIITLTPHTKLEEDILVVETKANKSLVSQKCQKTDDNNCQIKTENIEISPKMMALNQKDVDLQQNFLTYYPLMPISNNFQFPAFTFFYF